jgi:hypothetical protein
MPFIDDMWSRKYSSSLGFNKTADPLAFRYAHLEDGDPTPGEIEPCWCQKNEYNRTNGFKCPKCLGMGYTHIEVVDDPSAKIIDIPTRMMNDNAIQTRMMNDDIKTHMMKKRIEQPMAQEEVDKQYNGNPAWLDRSRLGSKKTAELAREMECASCGDPMFYSMARDNDPPSPATPRCEECKKPIHQQCSAIRPGLLCFQCVE